MGLQDNTLRRRIIEVAYRSGTGHIPSALSIVDILGVLYGSVMRYHPDDPGWAGRDYFILSKGHGALALYAVLERLGMLDMSNFCREGSSLLEHPEMGIPGVEAATGSLGHGLPMAVGIAQGLRIRGLGNRVWCLVGDGECNEGTVWESALLAQHLRLNNLCCIVDDNRSSLLSMDPLGGKWRTFGWDVREVGGHDRRELEKVLLTPSSPLLPMCVIARTVKGSGVPMMEGSPQWHHRVPNPQEYAAMMEALE